MQPETKLIVQHIVSKQFMPMVLAQLLPFLDTFRKDIISTHNIELLLNEKPSKLGYIMPVIEGSKILFDLRMAEDKLVESLTLALKSNAKQ